MTIHGVLGAVVVVSFVVFLVHACIEESEMDASKAASKRSFLAQHLCTVSGYVGEPPEKVYRCNDGEHYVWRDLPPKGSVPNFQR